LYSLSEVREEQISSGNTAKFDILLKQVLTIGFEGWNFVVPDGIKDIAYYLFVFWKMP